MRKIFQQLPNVTLSVASRVQHVKLVFDAMNPSVFEQAEYSTLLFLDIKKAFDSVSHKKLIEKLKRYGLRGVANGLIKSYLEKRKQFVSIANFNSSDLVIEYGVPQGFILGPLLFLIYINDLSSCLQSLRRFFADDTALLITGKTLKDIPFQANLKLSNVLQWMNANSLILNAAKSEAL